ncbi:hypothetical protein C2R22_06965 [Salinigranum rubrum]|uniref:Uncharacterized protein n=1 Tax=Salinigranum rubrum TaxID=755307 RepID=A0A2I8VHL7_9EURY|nr:hypothetical protein [Salinigranum rubrum]AUV81426.1 hypothetical protein C2R22_06965 [Salinigranum rubrum]
MDKQSGGTTDRCNRSDEERQGDEGATHGSHRERCLRREGYEQSPHDGSEEDVAGGHRCGRSRVSGVRSTFHV